MYTDTPTINVYAITALLIISTCSNYCATLSRVHIVDIGLVDKEASAKGEKLGFVRLFISITQGSEDDEVPLAAMDSPKSQRKAGKSLSASGSKRVWSGVLTVTLLEGKNLPAKDDNG